MLIIDMAFIDILDTPKGRCVTTHGTATKPWLYAGAISFKGWNVWLHY